MPPTIELQEMWAPTRYFEAAGIPNNVLLEIAFRHGIQKDARGWPVFKFVHILNELRKNRTAAGSLQEELTKVKIKKEETNISIKMREYIKRDIAVDRIRTALQAVANKIRYAIKASAPQVCGLTSTVDIEDILTLNYNSAIEQIEKNAKLEDWDVYGIDMEQKGDTMAPNSEEATSSGSSEEDQSVDQNEHSGQNRSIPDAVPQRSDKFNW